MKRSTVNILASYIDALHPIIYINHFDFKVIDDTIELAFIEGRSAITTDDLIKTVKDTKSISSTLKEKIKEIKATIEKIDIKPASKEDQKS